MQSDTRNLLLVIAAVVLSISLGIWLTWKHESGTISGMSWERTIEIVQKHTGTRWVSNGKGGTKRQSYTYYTTVESKTLNGVWPTVPQWPTMRACSWLRSESYRNNESYLVRINSDAQRIRDYNPNNNEYMTFTPKERVWVTIFFWWCIWNVEPLKLEV